MPKSVELPDVQFLRECFDYNPETGDISWKERPVNHFSCTSQQSRFNKRYSGNHIRTKDSAGYYMVDVNKRSYKAHRIIFAMMNGLCPVEMEIDHINGIRTDNRLENLRLVTISANCRNRKKRADNKTGYTGVCLDKESGKFFSHIKSNGKQIRIGRFKTPEEAHLARDAWISRNKSEGYTDQHGRRTT